VASIHRNRYNKDKVIKQFIDKHGDYYDYRNVIYFGDNKKVCIICPIHGEFMQTPSNHKRGQKCPKCSNRNPITLKEVINEFNNVHNKKYDYSKIINVNKSSDKVNIICPTHGEFTQTINNHKRGQGCKKCAGLNKPSNETLINNFKLIHGNKYDYSKVKYESAHKKIKIVCPMHGDFMQTPNNHKNGNGCPICKQSNGENQIKLFLENNFIAFIPQYKFKNCKNIFKLPFDFYLPEYNTCIEYNGMQHYKPIKYFGGDEAFKQRKINDKIKMEYCNKNNIPLIIIRYNEDVITVLTNHLK
jgi:hypothetical protein